MMNRSTMKNNWFLLLDRGRQWCRSLINTSSHATLQRITILVIISLTVAFLLAPRTGWQPPVYKIDTIADSNVKADRNFLVEKKAATEQKRMEAINDILSVYDYNSEVANQVLTNLLNAFALMRDITPGPKVFLNQENDDVLATSKRNFENLTGISLGDDEFRILLKTKFSPLLAANITNLIKSVYHDGMITNVTFLPQENDKGIIVRNVREQTEKKITDPGVIRHFSDIESVMQNTDIKLGSLENEDVKRAILSVAMKLIKPNLIFNQAVTELRKRDVTKDIKPVYLRVQKGEMLVREGEKITPAVLDKLEAYYQIKKEKLFSNFLIFIGIFFIALSLGIVLYLYVDNKVRNDLHDLLFLSVVILMQILIVRAGIFISGAITEAFPSLPEYVFYYFIPFSICAMLVSLLVNRNLAFLASLFISVLITFLFDDKISIFVFSFLGSIVASYRIIDCKDRNAFIKVGLLLGSVNAATIIFLGLASENSFNTNTFITIIMGFTGGIMSGLIASGLLPLFESLFRFTTNIKLLELANLNQPIFQKMIIEAPGTYHHSVVVGSMVEAAAESIGANPLLAKVSAYYHDIGKLKKPQYFIENQLNGGNKHDKLSPKMSSLVIISHVKDGYEMALKAKLGKDIANIIRQHHGTGLVSYFFEKAKRDKDASIRALQETDFRYPGPKPQTREAGLVLLGDVLEASSRTLSNPTPGRIKTLVRERIESVFSDGQLDECELTLNDLNKMTESFTKILNGIFHHRIDYPEVALHEMNNSRKENNNGTHDPKPAEKNKGRLKAVTGGSE